MKYQGSARALTKICHINVRILQQREDKRGIEICKSEEALDLYKKNCVASVGDKNEKDAEKFMRLSVCP